MKNLKIVIISLLIATCTHKAYSQTINWTSLNTRHLVSVGVGWDYSLNYSVGYAYQLDTSIPVLLNGNISMPSGKDIFDDIKVKPGVQILVFSHSNFKGSVAINGIYRKYENPLVQLQNFGTELKGAFGFYQSNWFVAGEVGFDKTIVTHFKHTEAFKQNAFGEVKDGWYQPATGGNFFYGLQTGYSFRRSDLTFNIGKVITQDFKSTPLIPYYLMLGYNHKMGANSQ